MTRTINYLEKGTNKVLKNPTVETVTLTRPKTTNKVTGDVTYGEWSKGNWSEVTPEAIAKYKAPSVATVERAEVTSTTENKIIDVYYEADTKEVTEEKEVTRTINYLEKGTNKVLKNPTVETVMLTRTKTTNKVTGDVTYGEWSKGNWSEVTPEAIAKYKAPSVATVERAEVTSTTENKIIDVYYEADTEAGTEEKTVTRTINYLEKGTNKVLKNPTVETVTLTRPKTTNKVTGDVTYGEWSKGNWSEVTPEAIAKYKAPSVATVERAEVTSTTENKIIDVYYEADTKEVTEEKEVTRTINYLEKETNKVLKEPVVQKVKLTRTNKVNKVTGEVTEGKWTEGSWEEISSPIIENYYLPDKEKVEKEKVGGTSLDKEVIVNYTIKPKPEPKPEPKSEPKPEPKPEPKLQDVVVMQGVRKLANTGEKTTGFEVLGLISLVAAEVARRKKQN